MIHQAIDLHCDTAIRLEKGQALDRDSGHVTLRKLRAGNVSLQVFACWLSPKMRGAKAVARAERMVDLVRDEVARHPADLELVTDSHSWRRCQKKRKTGVMLAIEGGHALAGRIENLARFHKLGVRILTLTWNNSNPFACAAYRAHRSGRDSGLTPLGRRLVAAADSLGVIIDLAHSSPRTFWAVMEASTRPALVSHSCVRFLNPHTRNLSDDQLRALARKGWIVGINFYPGFLGLNRKPSDIESVADQIDYVRELAGIDCLALGSDFDGIDSLPRGLDGPDKLPDLWQALRVRGYTEQEIGKIASGNVLRFLGW